MNKANLLELATMHPITLGSGSPRRVHLLGETGIEFEQMIPSVDESLRNGEKPFDYARRLAEEKALEAASQSDRDRLVIGCDTIVVLDNQVLGKPENAEEAIQTLSRLAGKTHSVCTALALVVNEKVAASGYELTNVKFNEITIEQIRRYVESGEPLDKAGAYGIQGMGAFLVDSISGNLDNVIGFPRALLEKLAGDVLVNIRKQNRGA